MHLTGTKVMRYNFRIIRLQETGGTSIKDQSAPHRLTDRYIFAAIIAIELLMSFSFLGYIHVEPISVTIAYLPVLLAGVLLGPAEATAVGTVFGLASMWKASASYVMSSDQLFSPMFSGNPLGSLILSVGSRALLGLISGLLYEGARRLPHRGFWVGLVSFFGRPIHSLLVYSAMALFFPETGYGPGIVFTKFFSQSDILSNLGTTAVVALVWGISQTRTWLRFQSRLEVALAMRTKEHYSRAVIVVTAGITLAAALAVTVYFVHRIDYVLSGNGITLSDTSYANIMHLQVQFMLGIMSLMLLMVLFLILNRYYNAYMAYEGKIDSLTGAMTRRAFFSACGRTLESVRSQASPFGYFIMVDLDRFKEINDQHGHPEDDRALKGVAHYLKETLGEQYIIGRMGGDEFAALLCSDIPAEELEAALKHFLTRVHHIAWGEQHLTCSIGATPIRADLSTEELYQEADRLLYEAKEQGRDRYVIGS